MELTQSQWDNLLRVLVTIPKELNQIRHAIDRNTEAVLAAHVWDEDQEQGPANQSLSDP